MCMFPSASAAPDHSSYEGLWTADPSVSVYEDHRGIDITRADASSMDFRFFWYQSEFEIQDAVIDGNTVYGEYYEVWDDGIDWDNYVVSGSVTLILETDHINVLWNSNENGSVSSKNFDVYNPDFRYVESAPLTVMLNGNKVYFPDQQPVILNGRTLVPIRAMIEAMNGNVGWDEEQQQVSIDLGGHIIISLRINDYVMNVKRPQASLEKKKEYDISLDVPAQIINGRTMIPIRAVAEALDKNVDWDAGTNTVIIQ